MWASCWIRYLEKHCCLFCKISCSTFVHGKNSWFCNMLKYMVQLHMVLCIFHCIVISNLENILGICTNIPYLMFLYADCCLDHTELHNYNNYRKKPICFQDMVYLPKVLVEKKTSFRGHIFYFMKKIWVDYKPDTFYLLIPVIYVTLSKDIN